MHLVGETHPKKNIQKYDMGFLLDYIPIIVVILPTIVVIIPIIVVYIIWLYDGICIHYWLEVYLPL